MSAAQESPSGANSTRVLFVTRDETSRSRFCQATQDAGFDVEVVDCAEQALERAQQARFAVIAASEAMPATEGRELSSQVRQRWPDTTFVLLPLAPGDPSRADDGERIVHSLQRAIALHHTRARTRAHRFPITLGELDILLVEGDDQDAANIARCLQNMPHVSARPARCATLRGALERLESQRFSLVIADLTLPDANGPIVVRLLQVAAPSTPIVVLSSSHQQSLAFAAVDAGAHDYICKDEVEGGSLQRILWHSVERHLRTMQYRDLLALSSDGMLVVDPTGMVLFANLAATGLLQVDAAQLQGTRPPWLPERLDETQEIRLPNGRHVELRQAAAEWSGSPAHVLGLRDVSATVIAQDQLAHLARHDQLTGLGNRLRFSQELRKAIANHERHGRGFVLVTVRLDDFEAIVGRHGPDVADATLVEASTRLFTSLRKGDLVARLSGPEFAVLAPETDGELAANTLATRIVSALAPAFVYANQRIDISVRAGVAICPHDGTTGDELFTRAELAMHQVDTTAEARYRFADANVHDRVRRVAMREADLRDTAAVDGFEVHYQPRVTHAGAVAFEALLRWPRARDELMAASSFVPDLERTGLMVSVGHWVLRQAIGQFVASERGRESLAYLAVNAGLVELRCDEFVARVEEALAEHGFAPHRLELGISEAVALSANKRARQALRWLRSLGVRIAIDDFGTVCPLAQCLDLVGEVDAVTIERSLVHGLERGEPRAALVSALISFGRSAGLDVVAQGIESTGELEILRGCGCEIFQGNLFSPPVPADRLAKAREDQPEAPPDVKMIADR